MGFLCIGLMCVCFGDYFCLFGGESIKFEEFLKYVVILTYGGVGVGRRFFWFLNFVYMFIYVI